MSHQRKNLDTAAKTEYLKTILDTYTNRRDSLETKSSILLASNAILLTALMGLGIPIAINNFALQYLLWFRIALISGALIFAILSTLIASDILAPVLSDRQRRNLLDIPVNEHNLFWFGKVAELRRDDFFEKIDNITEEEIFSQLISEIHNVSRIIMLRYRILNRAYRCFVICIILFSLLAFTHLFLG